MNRGKRIFRGAAALVCLLSSATALWLIPLERVSAQTPGDSVIYLDQGWSEADRELYYQIPQGSVIASYDIFTNMEVAGSQELFRSDANSARLGLILQAANPRTNPDGFPIGVTKNVVTEGRWKGVTVGPTCSICHTAQLMYKGKQIRIDGGHTNLFDIQAYMQALDQAYQATLTDTAKFDRMAARIGATSTDAKSELRTRFGREAERTHYYSGVAAATPFPWGPGRADCLTLINNRMTSIAPNIPENMSVATAPVKIPFVWNAGQATWTQWGGWAQDPLARNFGETLGVYLPMDLQSKTPQEGLFDSAAALLNLQKIEDTMWRLAPPKWPEEIFGKIDRVKAAQGKALFATHCASCHNSYPYTWTPPNKYGKRFLEVGLVPKTYMGTDMQQTVVVNEFMHTAQLSPYMPPPDKGNAVVATPVFRAALARDLLGRAVEKLKLSAEEMPALNGFRELPSQLGPQTLWKAAPRDGVWATPPFLHNGSVPNLYEMLIPASQRTKKFYVGRDFDPVKVGVDTSGNSGTFLLDTSLLGNSNAGHSFENGARGNGIVGPLLTDQQRWALVEYLKSIPEEAGRVTPFGGPPNARSGNQPWANTK
jgi:processive rubber oxygenase RoxA-like protein